MAKNDSNALPFLERPDLSPFLVHLTKNTIAEDKYDAFDNLCSILKTGEIFGSTTAKGFIKGRNPATCFMDVPLSSLKYILNESNTTPSHPRYEPFGIVVSKKFAYDNGGRPVLYLSDAELKTLKIPSEELWRVVRLEGVENKSINWLHEREWRAKGSFSLPSKVRAVLVKNTQSAERLQRIIERDRKAFESVPASIIPLSVLCQGLPYLYQD